MKKKEEENQQQIIILLIVKFKLILNLNLIFLKIKQKYIPQTFKIN